MSFEAITDFFKGRGLTPFEFQVKAWERSRAGQHQLILCPTGSGKTLAASGAILDTLIKQDKATGLRLLYITPLRAMTRDLEQALAAPLSGTAHRVGTRSGDTPAKERAALFRKPPQVLLTTPESLSVLLTSPKAPDLFSRLESIVVDEWHDLWASKRGVQTQLALARVRRLAPHATVTGVSATLKEPNKALDALLGPHTVGVLTEGLVSRDLFLEVLETDNDSRIPWAGHLGLSLLKPLARALVKGQTTVIFTNTRNQAEQWYQALSIVRADLQVRLHHGSLAMDARHDVEAGLKDGEIDVAVATSALDLGVDYPAVERIVQIGSARAVSRLVQRAGRANHTPGASSTVLLAPTHRLHLHEYAALADALDANALEPIRPPGMALDVLMQHLVTLACQSPWEASAVYEEITDTEAYRELSRTQFDQLVTVLHQGSHSLTEYPEFSRLIPTKEGRWQVSDRRTALRHRMSIGTIVSHSQVTVKVRRGSRLGQVEESFASRLPPGSRFRFAGRCLEVISLSDGELLVKAARSQKAMEVPRWTGGRLPLSDTLAERVLARMNTQRALSPRIRNRTWLSQEIAHTEAVQSRLSQCPDSATTLIERYQSRDGHHLWFYPFGGWLVHQALGPLLAYRLSQQLPATLTLTVNDYGIELLADEAAPLNHLMTHWPAFLSASHVLNDLTEAINLSELVKRQFRSTARIAGWLFEGYPGRTKSMRALQTSASLLHDVLQKYDPEHLLLQQARSDVLSDFCDLPRLTEAMERLAQQPLTIRQLTQPSPMALPLMIERLEARLSSDTVATRLARLTANFDDTY